MNRRTFIKKGMIAGGALLSGSFLTQVYKPDDRSFEMMVPGVQIYSVRNELEKDMNGTLRMLSEIGFSTIEGYGLLKDGSILNRTIKEFKDLLRRNELKMPSCHCEYFEIKDAEQMLENSLALGLDYLVIPYLNDTQRADYSAVADNLNEIGTYFSKYNLKLGYHNHDFEFLPLDDGTVPMELLIEKTEKGVVWFEADLYWIRKAGKDPLSWMNKYPDRFHLFHIKDANKQLEQTTVGTGIIDFKGILSTFDSSVIAHIFIEDERTSTPLKNVAAGFNYIQQLG